MKLDYDKVMSFLAGTPVRELVALAANPALLEEEMLAACSRDWGSLEPDSQEALEAAEADAETYDRAEETIYRLVDKHPEVWEAVKAVVRKHDQQDGTAEFLDRYSKEDLDFYRWEDPSEEAPDETT